MVMPKWNWTLFNQGDWFLTKPLYAVGRNEEQRDERELTNIEKIEPKNYSKYKIPPTRVEFGTVKIRCPFMLCPDWIQNRETRNAYGSYKKLLLMNIGQGFVSSNIRNGDFNKLLPGIAYIGVFEFRAKDNGACNFGHRSSLRDFTNHVLERDAMWELTQSTRAANQEESNAMSDWLKEVRNNAEEFYHELEQQGAYKRRSRSISRPLLEGSSADCSVADVTRKTSRLSLSSTRSNSSFKSQPTDESNSRNQTLVSQPDFADYGREFDSVQELEEHRKKTIVYISVREDNGKVVKKWFDHETKQSSPDNDLLYFKFDARHKVTENPRPASRATSVLHTPRNRTLSESSVRTNTLGLPVATSTPCPSPTPSSTPSPVAQRRLFEDSQYRTIQMDEGEDVDEDGNDGDTLDQTSNTTLLLQDNNANPVYRTPFMRR